MHKEIEKIILGSQHNEITEHFLYRKLAERAKNSHNKEVLGIIATEEMEHYNFWRRYTHQEVKPNQIKIGLYFLISRIFGLTFSIKLMEKGEQEAQETYEKISHLLPEAKVILKDEDEHEKKLINLIDEERLKYLSSMVLGLSDALIELTGALAGLTLALQNTRLIALTGFITGLAASLSMSSSEYLSTKSEETIKNPLKSSIYTGLTYLLTVVFLILPYLFLKNYYLCLGLTILIALIVIYFFTFYISVAKDIPFKRRFLEMSLLSLSIAALTFAIGFLIRKFFNLEI